MSLMMAVFDADREWLYLGERVRKPFAQRREHFADLLPAADAPASNLQFGRG